MTLAALGFASGAESWAGHRAFGAYIGRRSRD